MSRADPNAVPSFHNVQIIIKRMPEGGGNTDDGMYNVAYIDPQAVTVKTPNSIVNYQLIEPTPRDIVFTGMRTDQPGLMSQFSHPTISMDGKMMTFIDNDGLKSDINVTLLWRDGKELHHDPQVINDPQST